VSLALPKLETAADSVKAVGAIIEAVASGELTPGEGGDIVRIEGELAEAMDRPKITGDIVSTWFERAEGLPTFDELIVASTTADPSFARDALW
jgi:hypothetical protein